MLDQILCIDDDANLLLTIKDYLLDEKFDAYSACSGAEPDRKQGRHS